MGNFISGLFKRQPDQQQIQAAVDQQLKSILPGLMASFNAANGPLSIVPSYQGATNNTNIIQNGYCGSAEVYSIVKLIAKTAATIPLYVYEVKDEAAMRKYKDAMNTKTYSPEHLYNIGKLQEKALEAVGEDDELQKLLDNPDDRNNKQDVYEGFYGFRLLTGDSFIYMPVIPDGANKGKVEGLYSMPSQYTDIIATTGFPKRVLSYQMIANSIQMMRTDEVLHLKYFNPDFSVQGAELRGMSPLRAGYKIWMQQQAGTDNSVAQYQHGGPAGMMGNKNINPEWNGAIEQIGKIKQRWDNEYSGPANAGKVAFTPGEPVYVTTGLSPADLKILEAMQLGMGRLCNLWSVSDTLFNNNTAATESNIVQQIKRLYTNAALPEVFALRDGGNRKIATLPYYSKGKYRKHIDADVTGIPELQDDMKALATWLDLAWWITPNEKRDMMKFGKYNDPSFDEPWIKQGNTLLSDNLMQPEPLELDPNNPEAM